MDSAIAFRPITRLNNKDLGGFFFAGITYEERLNTEIITFNNPYKKTNRDIVIINGCLYLGDEYGQTMERETICYVFMGVNK